jgi:tetratricopeptide (TPR) repeat protein
MSVGMTPRTRILRDSMTHPRPAVHLLACLILAATAPVWAADTVTLTDGSEVDGPITSLAPGDIEVEQEPGDRLEKISIVAVRDVRFGDEPESLSSGRALLERGDGPGAVAELAKIAEIELQEGVAGPRVRQEHAFVKVAAEALAAGPEQRPAAIKALAEFLDSNARSHHSYAGQELLGDLLAESGDFSAAAAAYEQLDRGPPALRIRSANLRAGLLIRQERYAEAAREFEAAERIPLPDSQGKSESKLEQTSKALALAAALSERQSAVLGRARCLAKTGKAAEAVAAARAVIAEADPENRDLLAAAYGTLGECQRAAGNQDTDALISFLTVDLVYNAIPEWHARALFNLVQLWGASNQPERARQAAQLLTTTYPESPWAQQLAPNNDAS